jgi:hypothetical protein
MMPLASVPHRLSWIMLQNQIRVICMFLEMIGEMKGTTPAGVECLVNIDISINM